jgi:hypothetical protein
VIEYGRPSTVALTEETNLLRLRRAGTGVPSFLSSIIGIWDDVLSDRDGGITSTMPSKYVAPGKRSKVSSRNDN